MKALEGRSYGPFSLRVCAEKVAEFVAATSDDPDRWTRFAPPGWAAAAMFVVAPRLLEDPDLGDAGTTVLHGDQRFGWAGPIPIESDLQVIGIVSRVRERGGVFFTTFEFEARGPTGALMTGSSTFLMSGSSPPTSSSEAVEVPSPSTRGRNDPLPVSIASAGARTVLPTGRRSASRSDLVRYAAATRDWNPIHWDHESAVAAGLPTVVVHGLLQASWLLGSASAVSDQPAPIVDAKFRFRSPMTAGSEAGISGEIKGSEAVARLVIGEREIVSATMNLR